MFDHNKSFGDTGWCKPSPITLMNRPVKRIVDAIHLICPACANVSCGLFGTIDVADELVDQDIPGVTIWKWAAARIRDESSEGTEHLVVRVGDLPLASYVGDLNRLILSVTH
eukprot:748320-Hanusia_phi.AAC.2